MTPPLKSQLTRWPLGRSLIKFTGTPQAVSRVVGRRLAGVVCGNKRDLVEREVGREEGEGLGREWGFPFFEISAKEGLDTSEMMQEMITSTSFIHLLLNNTASANYCNLCRTAPLTFIHSKSPTRTSFWT
eukprot:TRINITY_DN6955_c0_g1_i1.p1 TRINITY_DN6955_c0_g1~~TRINITY_DN6955_c0_g1_i1.p1  ORF type:complete len:130 (-),score=23.59 TRINITY_DN6955_c0_g1_i1:50-439(-)